MTQIRIRGRPSRIFFTIMGFIEILGVTSVTSGSIIPNTTSLLRPWASWTSTVTGTLPQVARQHFIDGCSSGIHRCSRIMVVTKVR